MEQQITLLEKYFPKTFDDLLLPTKIKNQLLELRKQKGYRLLMFSSPGTGKTTTSRLLTTGIEYETMYLSGSNDFNIDTYRNKVQNFAAGVSVLQKQKCIIIDESENIRDNLQDAFKILLDKCTNVNFIFITNEVEKMNDAVKSRCTNLEYDFVGDDLTEQKRNFVNFTINVCKEENIAYDKEGLSNIFKLNFPDFRHLLVNLQQIKDAGESLTIESVKRFSESGKQNIELYDLILNPMSGKDFYVEISKQKGKEKDCLIALGEPFFNYLNSKGMFEKTLESAIIVSKYYDMYVNSINKFVTFVACVNELKSLFK